jgi:hypothetical protein
MTAPAPRDRAGAAVYFQSERLSSPAPSLAHRARLAKKAQ